MYFDLDQYFGRLNEITLSSSDINRAYKIRDDLNSFNEISDQVRYVNNRRKSSKNRRFDERVFGISVQSYLDKNKYSVSATEGKFNDNWNGKEKAAINPENLSRLATIKGSAAAMLKPAIAVFIIFLIINIVIYVSGLVGSVGETPFNFCEDGKPSGGPSISVDGGSKEKDGYFLPIDYEIAGDGYAGQGWNGDPEERGKGIFASEDFRWGGDDSFSKANYAISSRWEYVGYAITPNLWPGHDAYGNGTSDGVDISRPYTNLDSAQYSWTVKQKVMVVNPDNGKAVVTIVGNGEDNPNWGGSPLNTVAGLSYKAQEALGFKAGGLDGGDYDKNSRDSGIVMEMFWVDSDTEVGPVDDIGAINSGNISSEMACAPTSNIGGGNSSIADAAVSLAHETMDIATPNSGPNNGNGTDLYINIHDKVLAGDPWYQSCDRFAATSVRWAGADDNIPAGATGNILEYLRASSKWEYIPAKSEDDIEPGDIIVKTGHIIVYAGLEAVQKRFPNSTAVLAHASIGSASSPEQQTTSAISNNRAGGLGSWYDMGLKEAGGGFEVFRNIEVESNSVYKDISP